MARFALDSGRAQWWWQSSAMNRGGQHGEVQRQSKTSSDYKRQSPKQGNAAKGRGQSKKVRGQGRQNCWLAQSSCVHYLGGRAQNRWPSTGWSRSIIKNYHTRSSEELSGKQEQGSRFAFRSGRAQWWWQSSAMNRGGPPGEVYIYIKKTHIMIYIYIYVSVRVCVCVCGVAHVAALCVM